MPVEPAYRTILILDIEQFGRTDRDDQVRVRLRRTLREVLAEALGEAGIPTERYSTSDTGDGLLVLVDPAIPTARVVRAMLDLFAAAVAEHNRLARAVAQLRVRAAIHAGQLLLDQQGATGEQLNLAFRLLDAPQLRARLAQAPTPTMVCVSDDVYRQVVRQRHLWLDPEAFHVRPVRVSAPPALVGGPVVAGRVPPVRLPAVGPQEAEPVDQVVGDRALGIPWSGRHPRVEEVAVQLDVVAAVGVEQERQPIRDIFGRQPGGQVP
jgi:class 3 adenylate cyclase